MIGSHSEALDTVLQISYINTAGTIPEQYLQRNVSYKSGGRAVCYPTNRLMRTNLMSDYLS